MEQKQITIRDVELAFGQFPWVEMDEKDRNCQVLNYICSKAAKALKDAEPYLPKELNDIIANYPYLTAGICAKGMAWAFTPSLLGNKPPVSFTIEDYNVFFKDNWCSYSHDVNMVAYPSTPYNQAFAIRYWQYVPLLVLVGIVSECCFLLKKNFKTEMKSKKVQKLVSFHQDWANSIDGPGLEACSHALEALEALPALSSDAHISVIAQRDEAMRIAENLKEIKAKHQEAAQQEQQKKRKLEVFKRLLTSDHTPTEAEVEELREVMGIKDRVQAFWKYAEEQSKKEKK